MSCVSKHSQIEMEALCKIPEKFRMETDIFISYESEIEFPEGEGSHNARANGRT